MSAAARVAARSPTPAPRPAAAGTAARQAPNFRGGTAHRAPGRSLPAALRLRLEQSFASDLAAVRVHDDSQAQAAARAAGSRAFTVGADIFLGPGERADDLGLIAHEAAHVIQQGGGAAPAVQRFGATGGALESEAANASAVVLAGGSVVIAGRTGGAALQREERKPWYQRGAEWVGDLASGALEFGESVGWRLLEQFVPELAPMLRNGPAGVLDWLQERVSAGLGQLFELLMTPLRSVEGMGRQLTAQFAPLVAWVQDAAGRIARNDCSPLREAAAKIEALAQRIIQPIVERIQPLIARAERFFAELWAKFGAPVWEWIRKVAGAQWEQLQRLATWVWDKALPIRRAAARAWTWLKNKIGIGDGPDGQDGILQWVQAKVGVVWDRVKARLAPFQKEIATAAAIVGGVALMVSPAGPLVAMGAIIVGVVQGVRWIRAHWKGNLVVQARDYLRQTLLPGLIAGSQRLGTAATGVARGLAAAIQRFAERMGSMVGAVAASALQFAVAAVQWIATQVTALAQWAVQKFAALADGLESALNGLQRFLQRTLDFLGRIARVVVDIWGLPILLAGKLWNLIPACIRDPVVDFLVPIILRQVELFRELVSDNDAWQKTRKDIGKLIRLVFRDHDLMGAVKASFRLLLRVFNVPVELAATVLRKAMAAWDQVMARPIAFIKNTVRAVGSGFRRLWKNLRFHLSFGIEGWLFGELSDKGIRPPGNWSDPLQLFGFVLDVLGLSMDHVFDLMKQRFDARKVEKLRVWYGRIRSAVTWVREAIDTSKSPAENTKGIIEKAKDFGKTVLTGVVEWVVGKVAEELAILAAAAAASGGLSEVLDVLRRIYKAIKSAVRYMRRILEMANKVLDTVLDIVAGAIDKAGERFESAMHSGMPVVIGFLADQVGLGGIGAALRDIVTQLRAKVDQAILWLIDKIKAGLDALMAGLRSAAKALLQWWKTEEPIPAGNGEKHRVYVDGDASAPRVMVASEPMDTAAAVALIEAAPAATAQQKDAAAAFRQSIDDAVVILVAQNKLLASGATPGNKAAPDEIISAQHSIMRSAMRGLAELLGKTVFGPVQFADLEPTVITPNGSDRADTIEAAPLSANREMGSPPSVAPIGWDAIVAEGLTEKAPHYVRLHLINENFGGPGDDVLNLVPGSKQNNGDHLRTVENQLKDLIGAAPGKASGKFAQVWYKAKVNYRSGETTPWAKVRYQSLKAADFARSINFTWGLYKRAKGKWTRDSKAIGNFTLGPIPLPDL